MSLQLKNLAYQLQREAGKQPHCIQPGVSLWIQGEIAVAIGMQDCIRMKQSTETEQSIDLMQQVQQQLAGCATRSKWLAIMVQPVAI